MTGVELRALRLELGLTQSELADRLMRSERTILRWENGQTRIPSTVERQLSQLQKGRK